MSGVYGHPSFPLRLFKSNFSEEQMRKKQHCSSPKEFISVSSQQMWGLEIEIDDWR